VGGDAKSAKAVESGRSGKTVKTVRRKAAVVKAAERREVEREVQVQVQGVGRRRLRGSVVEY